MSPRSRLALAAGLALGCAPDPAARCVAGSAVDPWPDPERPSSAARLDLALEPACAGVENLRLVGSPTAGGAARVVPLDAGAPEELRVAGLVADTAYDWRVEACAEAGCAASPAARQATEPEVWFLRGVPAISADGERFVEANRVGCIDVFRYPSGWALADHLGVYFIRTGDGYDDLRFTRTAEAGWQDWNGAALVESTPVARNADLGTGWSVLSCPWAVPVEQDGERRVDLFVEVGATDPDTGESTTRTALLTSVDETGDDLGLTCAAGGCPGCAPGLPCDFDDASGDGGAGRFVLEPGEGVAAWGHGRALFDESADHAWDPDADDLAQLVTASFTEEATAACDLGEARLADVVRVSRPAGGAWAIDRDEAGCPLVAAEDEHDPSVVAREAPGAWKVYTLDATWSALTVAWSEDGGRTWHDRQPVEILLDDGTGEPDFDGPFDVRCMEDQDHLLWVEDGQRREAMFFSARSHDVEFGCFPPGRNGFVAAELWN